MDSLKNKPDEGSGASLLVFHPYRPMEQYVEGAPARLHCPRSLATR
jgi:hypothetical protein